MVGRTQSATKADKARFNALYQVGCLCCHIEGWGFAEAQIHHVVEGRKRLGLEFTVRLCPHHHSGEVPPICCGNVAVAERRFGPSLAHNKGGFIARYGTERDLVMVADRMVERIGQAAVNGEYLPEFEIGSLVQQFHREVIDGA